ncbi:Biopolymer transport protein ExbD/TolR [Rippkaea orientalis PCC 8801]|uniref:Biopolymer transport protein ExbD/TolR n=1 Tax=Rippkaea orientalis (strain PCC 8801 / RF-1) TaxID=41431 RepID=B7JWF5_RIPO1|nr:biopolymer transporter ExbD [Rippkaea orientalis]ACK67000.1 Biopolymer transport protein ExbD/TolR [Rippkaea orientalis PCC 8801]
MRLPDEMEPPGQIDIVPMIDIIFSILAYVIISTLSLTRSAGLPVNLPSAKTAQPQQTKQINVTIESDGDVFLDRQPIQVDSLKSTVGALIGQQQEGLVIINADQQVDHGRVVKVMDILRQVPGAKLAIAATKE